MQHLTAAPNRGGLSPHTRLRVPARHVHIATRAAAAGEAQSRCPVLTNLKPLPKADNITFMDRVRYFGDVQSLVKMAHAGGRRFVQDKFMMVLPTLLIGDLALAKELAFSEGSKVFSSWPKATRELLGDGSLVTINDMAHHKQLRANLNAVLGVEAVDTCLPQIQELATSLLDGAVDSTSGAGRTILGLDLTRKLTFQMILRLSIGEGSATDADMAQLERELQIWMRELFTPLAVDKFPFPFHGSMQARRQLLAFIQRHIDRVRQEVQADSSSSSSGSGGSKAAAARNKPLLYTLLMMCSANKEGDVASVALSDEQLASLILNLLFAGYDTSASAMTNTLYMLAQHPKVWQRLREEQDQLVQQYGDTITPQVFHKMKYTEAVVKETMRWLPPVGGAFRQATHDFELQGHLVPKDTFITMNYSYITSHDDRWLNSQGGLHASMFNPDRFLTEEGQKVGSFVPFGIGPRVCPGNVLSMAEQKVFLAVLARHYDYAADVTDEFDRRIVPYPANKLPMFVSRRPARAP